MNRKEPEKKNKKESSVSENELKTEQELFNKEEVSPKKADETASDSKKKKTTKLDTGPEKKQEEKLVQLETEIANLKKEKLILLADMDNQQKNFQKQILESYKYNNQRIIKRILDFLVDLEERVLKPALNENSKEGRFRRLRDELKGFSAEKDKSNRTDKLVDLVNELEENLTQEKKRLFKRSGNNSW